MQKLVSIICFLGSMVLGQLLKAQQIQGFVKDNDTKLSIPFTNLYIQELHTGSRADSSGKFILKNLPSNTVTIQVSAIGYKTLQIKIDSREEQKEVITIFLEPYHVELNEVVISMPTGKLSSDNIVMIEKKSIKELSRSTTNSLAEGLATLPGVDQTSTGTGIGKPVIRGLSGNRVVTYAQGIRIENQQWGSEHGLGVGENGLSEVEIIKGPNSLLYGPDAIGGVLFFTDEPYAEANSTEGFIKGTALSNTLGSQSNIGIKTHQGKYKQNLFASYKTNSDYMVPNGDRVVNTRFDEKNIKTSIGYNNAFWVTNLRYSFLENNFGITNADSLYHSNSDKNQMLPFQNIRDHKLSSENIFFINQSKIELTLGYIDNDRKEYEDSKEEAALDMQLSTFSYNLRYHLPILNEKQSLIIGAQGMQQRNKNAGEEVLIPDANTIDNGIYALWNGSFSDFGFLGGIRFDQRKLEGLETSFGQNEVIEGISRTFNNFNYSGGAMYAFGLNTFRLNISSGFRAPNTSELLSYGEHEGSNRFEIGDPNLKSENANQLDLSYAFQNEHIEITINPYYNVINNYINLSPIDSVIEGSPVYVYEQFDATLYGGELGIHYHPHNIHWLHFETAYSNITGIQSNKEYLSLMPANKINSMLKAELNNSKKDRHMEFFLQHTYKFEQKNTAVNELASSAYQVFDLGFIIEFQQKKSIIDLKAGVNNLFNKTYIDHLSRLKIYDIPGQGRNLFVSVAYRF